MFPSVRVPCTHLGVDTGRNLLLVFATFLPIVKVLKLFSFVIKGGSEISLSVCHWKSIFRAIQCLARREGVYLYNTPL